jgi:hypothetical protein
MATLIDGLQLRKRLGKAEWMVPAPWGPEGWMLKALDGNGIVLVSAAPAPDNPSEADEDLWLHASISRREIPSYEDLVMLHKAVWPDGWAYQLFAPPADHVNIHPRALHLWGRLDGSPALPNFGMYGTI